MNSSKYNLVMYQEDMVQNFIALMLQNKGKNISQVKYAYILHDKDILEETGELKKAHYHLYIEFPSQVKSNIIDSLLEAVGGSSSMRSNEITNRNFLAYLTHSTNYAKEVKKSYDYEAIKTNWSQEEFKEMYYEAVSKATKPSRQSQKIQATTNFFEQVYLFLNDNNEIISYGTLVLFLSQNNLGELLEYAVSHAFAVKEAFKEQFRRNNLRYQAEHIENETRANIDDNMSRLKRLAQLKIESEKQSDKIDYIEQVEMERIKNDKSNN